MRPVAAPNQAVGILGNQRFVEAPRIRIIRRDAADAMRARKLDPAAARAD
jgi:hypothetical protein